MVCSLPGMRTLSQPDMKRRNDNAGLWWYSPKNIFAGRDEVFRSSAFGILSRDKYHQLICSIRGAFCLGYLDANWVERHSPDLDDARLGRCGASSALILECLLPANWPEFASLIGQLGQARIELRAGVSFTRVTLLFAVWWLLLSEAAARMHRIGSGEPRFWTRFEAQQTSSASSIPSSAWDDPDRDRCELWSGHAAASDARRKSVPSAHMR